MKQSKSPLIWYGLLVFSISGICVASYLIYDILNPRKDWSIELIGNLDAGQKKEIEETVRYFIKLNKNRANKSSLKEILKLNPRVSEIMDITISSRKKIVIELKLKETAYVYHNPQSYQFQEFSLEEETLEAEMNNFHKIDKKIPILCLTKSLPSKENLRYTPGGFSYAKMRRDIMSTFGRTKIDYGFVWQYISEICLGRSPYRYTIYSSHTRSRIQTNDKFDMGLIRRLWSIFYYLEKNFKAKSTEVKLNQYNAHIKINRFF